MSPHEYCLLEDFLYEAIFIPEGIEPPPYDIIYLPELYMYIEDFGSRPSDLAVVAEVDGAIVGAAWARIMKDYGYVDDQTPSLSISLRPNFRGQGIGTKLWQTLLDHLYKAGYHQCSLSVQKANFATKMYLHSGFYVVRENPEDYVMVKRLRE
jgi:hypothetical protein